MQKSRRNTHLRGRRGRAEDQQRSRGDGHEKVREGTKRRAVVQIGNRQNAQEEPRQFTTEAQRARSKGWLWEGWEMMVESRAKRRESSVGGESGREQNAKCWGRKGLAGRALAAVRGL
jgi:hypothetical protein